MKTTLILALATLLLLSTAAVAQDRDMKMKVFDVSALTSPRHDRHAAPLGLKLHSFDYGDQDFDDEEQPAFEGDMIADLIRNSVTPVCWDEGGDVMYTESGLLIVRAWPEVLREVAGLLADLENTASRRVRFQVEVREYPAESYSKLPRGVVTAKELKELPEGTLRETSSAEAWPGHQAVLEVTNRVRYVQDYDVEIAQGSNISDPITRTADEGLAVELTPHLTSTGREIVVETRIQHGQIEAPMRTIELGVDEEYFAEPFRSEERFRLGRIMLPVFRASDTTTTTLMPVDGTLAIPVLSGGLAKLFLVTTEIRGTRNSVISVSLDALAERGPGFFYGLDPEDEDELDLLVPRFHGYQNALSPAFAAAEEIFDHILQAVTPWYWEQEDVWANVKDRQLLLSPNIKPEIRAAVLSLLSMRETETLVPVQIDLNVYSVEGRVATGPGQTISEGKPLLDNAVSLATMHGRKTGCLCGRTMNILADYDVEVAQEARIADPIIGQSFGGLVANLTPRLSLDRSRVQIDVDLLLADMPGPTSFDPETQFLGDIELTEQRRSVIRTQIELPTGSTYVLDAGPDPARPGRRLAVQFQAKATLPK